MGEKTKETMLVGVYYLEDNQAYEGLFWVLYKNTFCMVSKKKKKR